MGLCGTILRQPQSAFLTIERTNLGEPYLICNQQLSRVDKQVRAEYSHILRMSPLSVVAKVHNLELLARYLFLEDARRKCFGRLQSARGRDF